jgi:Holliday junction resolvasome RuvABC endonuclease subunit
MRTIIGIDPSSKKLALCITGTEVLQTDVIRLPAGVYSATGTAYREVFYYLESLNGAAVVYMEAPLVGRNVASTIVQAQVGGAVIAAARNSATELVLVNVGSWKKQVVGKGNALKEDAAAWLEKNWPEAYHLAQGDQDLVDAACINRYGVMMTELSSRRLRVRKAPTAPGKSAGR